MLPRATDLTMPEQVRLLSGQDFWHTEAVPAAGIPSMMMSDGPHGLRVQEGAGDHVGATASRPATCFPTAVTMASTWDEQLLVEVGQAVATEARALGVGLVLGPGLNIKRHPRCGRNFEYLSEDPLLSGRLAAALVTGIQSRGVGACLKHYAVNNQESHRLVVDAVVDERTLREIYLAGFEHAVAASGPWSVMAAYNSVNGQPCTASRRLLAEILRDEWGFDGLVVSDWGGTADRVRGLEAGLDLEMPGSGGVSDRDVEAAVHDGRLPADAVPACAQRVLDLVERAPRKAVGEIPVDTHDALARRVAADGSVLLRNEGLLPLPAEASVALVGAFAQSPRYQGYGSSVVNPLRLSSAREAFAARGTDVRYAPGYDPGASPPDQGLIDEAVDAARAADVAVVVVGLPGGHESEGFDRDHLRLPPQHDALVWAVCAANPSTVVVLCNGAPVVMPWRDQPAAILEAYLGGQAGGAALVDVLLGDREPGGRLAETFPVRQADVPSDPFFPGTPHQVEYREGLFVGYRHAVTAGVVPAFPFGHGLGYTTFGWEDAHLDRTSVAAGEGVTVSVRVSNTGGRPGSDVVQVYRHDRTAVVLRPRRELVGFAKVRLDPGESTTVTIDVAPRAFAFYDVEAADWRVPSGPYDLEVARSSADVVHTLDLEVTGGVTSAPEPPSTPPVAYADDDFVRRLGRPIPVPRPVRPFTRDSTLAEIRDTWLGGLLYAAALRAGRAGQEDAEDAPMIERSLDELPLRAAALFSHGRITWARLDLVLDLLNGRPAQAGRRAARATVGRLGRR
jgi:beta-glucosidase